MRIGSLGSTWIIEGGRLRLLPDELLFKLRPDDSIGGNFRPNIITLRVIRQGFTLLPVLDDEFFRESALGDFGPSLGESVLVSSRRSDTRDLIDRPDLAELPVSVRVGGCQIPRFRCAVSH